MIYCVHCVQAEYQIHNYHQLYWESLHVSRKGVFFIEYNHVLFIYMYCVFNVCILTKLYVYLNSTINTASLLLVTMYGQT